MQVKLAQSLDNLMATGRDQNSFVRCKARRDILEYGKKGLLVEEQIGRLRGSMMQELVKSLKDEIDDDVRRHHPIAHFLDVPTLTWLSRC